MKKLNGSAAKGYLAALRNPDATAFDELVTDANQQTSKSRVRQTVHQLIDAASSKRQRILIIIGD